MLRKQKIKYNYNHFEILFIYYYYMLLDEFSTSTSYFNYVGVPDTTQTRSAIMYYEYTVDK